MAESTEEILTPGIVAVENMEKYGSLARVESRYNADSGGQVSTNVRFGRASLTQKVTFDSKGPSYVEIEGYLLPQGAIVLGVEDRVMLGFKKFLSAPETHLIWKRQEDGSFKQISLKTSNKYGEWLEEYHAHQPKK